MWVISENTVYQTLLKSPKYLLSSPLSQNLVILLEGTMKSVGFVFSTISLLTLL